MRRPSARSIRFALIFALLLTVLGLGGVFKEVIVLSAACSLLALLLAIFRRQRISVDSFGLGILAIAISTALQTVPLPSSWVEALAPATAEVVRLGAQAQGLAPPTATTLSLDPESTRLAIVWWLAIFSIYLTTRQLQSHRDEQTPIVMSIPWIGVLILVSGLIHAAFGISSVYGLYEPAYQESLTTSDALYRSVFLNPNHLAAFLNVGLAIALAWAGAKHTSSRERVFYYAAFLLLALGVILTGSRAGILSGAVACGVVLIASRSNHHLGVIAACAGIALTLLWILPVGEQLASLAGVIDWSDSTHHQTHLLGIDILERWPWTGVGRGAFGVAHTMVGADRHYYITHAHNTPLQILIDYGWIVGGSILVGAAVLISKSFTQSMRSPLGAGVCGAILALLVHNLVDFSLDILGIAAVAAILASSLRIHASDVKLHRAVSTTFVFCALALVGWIYLHTGPEAGPRRESLVMDTPIAALESYPADAYAFLAASLEAKDAKLARHAAWLNPREPRIHLAVAALGDPTERFTAIHSALSSMRSYRYRGRCFEFIQRTAMRADDVISALPTPEITAHYLSWLSVPDEALLASALKKYPESVKLLYTVGQTYLKTGRLTPADSVATRLILQEAPEGYRLMGDVFLKRNKPLRAHHMFIAAGDVESHIKAVRIAVNAGFPRRALATLDRIGASPKHLKEMRELRAEAVTLLQTSPDEPESALEIFEN